MDETAILAGLSNDVDGRVELVHDGNVEGWAWFSASPRRRVDLEILLNGDPVGRTTADLQRPSLAAEGVGDGAHAFRFALPEQSAACALCVRPDGGAPLPPSAGFSVTVSAAGSPWSGIRFRIDHPQAQAYRPALDGRVEVIEEGTIHGWAWLADMPEQRVRLRVLLDGEEIGHTVADLHRPTLADAGVGDGRHAFRFAIPDSYAFAGVRVLRLELDGDPLTPAAGLRVESAARSDDPWYGARFQIDSEPAPPSANGGDRPVDGAGAGAGADAGAIPETVLGVGGWRFDGRIVRLASSPEPIAEVDAQVAALLDRLDQLQQRMTAIGTGILPILLPAKEHVYAALLPAGAAPLVTVRPGELIARGLLAHPTLEALDLMFALQAGAEQWPVFSPASPQLTDWGSYCAYRAVIKRIAATVAGVTAPIELGRAAVVEAPGRDQSESVATVRDGAFVPCPPETVPDPPAEPVVIEPPGGADQTPHEHLARLNVALGLGWEQPARTELARVMFIGDSSDADLVAWTARHFRYTLLLGGDLPLIDLVSLERPDLIGYLIDERSLLGEGRSPARRATGTAARKRGPATVTARLHEAHPSLRIAESVDRASPRLPVLGLLPKGGVGAELGVFAGAFSTVLYAHAEPVKLYLVDGWEQIWLDRYPDWGQYNDGGRVTPAIAKLAAEQRAAEMDGRAELVTSRTVDWLKSLPADSLDWVYADSSHMYGDTLEELRAVSGVLRPDGVVLGDDSQIDRAHRHHGVFRAVRDFCSEAPFEIIYLDLAKQWAIRRRAD